MVFVLSCVYVAVIRLSAELSVYRHSLAAVQHFKIPVIGFLTSFGSQELFGSRAALVTSVRMH